MEFIFTLRSFHNWSTGFVWFCSLFCLNKSTARRGRCCSWWSSAPRSQIACGEIRGVTSMYPKKKFLVVYTNSPGWCIPNRTVLPLASSVETQIRFPRIPCSPTRPLKLCRFSRRRPHHSRWFPALFSLAAADRLDEGVAAPPAEWLAESGPKVVIQ